MARCIQVSRRRIDGLRIKWIGRADGYHFNICRIMWERGSWTGPGYSCKLTFGVVKKFHHYSTNIYGTVLIVAGVRFALKRSYGGRYV